MSSEIQQYKNINLNNKGVPKIVSFDNVHNDSDNVDIDSIIDNNSIDSTIVNNVTAPVEETFFATLNNRAIRTLDVSDTDSVIDKDAVICKVCGRKLKDHHSRELGMGPQCYKHYKSSKIRVFNLLAVKEVQHE